MPTKAELEAQLSALQREFTTYKDRVRTRAIETADEEGWCRGGLNSALRDLDLAEHLTEYDVRISVTAYRDVTVRIKAQDDDDASDQAHGLTRAELAEKHGVVLPDGWEYAEHDVETVDEVAA